MKSELIPFYSDNIQTIKDEKTGTVYVPLKPIVQNLGIDWASQTVKIKQNNNRWKCCVITTVGQDGKNRKLICIPLKTLNSWLHSINSQKVRIDLRGKIEQYQDECTIVLYNYWNKGSANNPRLNQTSTFDFSNPDALQDPNAVGFLAQSLIKMQETMVENQRLREINDRVESKINGYIGGGMLDLDDAYNALQLEHEGILITKEEFRWLIRNMGILKKNKSGNYSHKCKPEFYGNITQPTYGARGMQNIANHAKTFGVHSRNPSFNSRIKQIHMQNEPSKVEYDIQDGSISIDGKVVSVTKE